MCSSTEYYYFVDVIFYSWQKGDNDSQLHNLHIQKKERSESRRFYDDTSYVAK